MKNIKHAVASVLLAGVMVLTAGCADKGTGTSGTGTGTSDTKWAPVTPDTYEADASAGETDGRAFMRFEEPVDIHIGMAVNPTDTTLSDLGDSVENNYFIRYIRDTYNINVIVDWYTASGETYNQKVATLIASNDLPDALVTGERSYFVSAAKDGLLAEMGDVFNEYASRQVLEIMNSAGDVAVEKSSYNGSFYSLPQLDVSASEVCVYFIRKDWLDELNMEVPETVSELEAAAKAFVEAGYSDYGIQGPQNNTRTYCTFMAPNPAIGMFDPVYQAMGAYPGYFVKGDDGKVYYGSTTDEFRKSLELLNRWYKEGLLNPELCVQTDVTEDINANATGIYMCSWWALGYGNTSSFLNDPNADWQSYPLYTDDGEWNYHVGNLGNGYTLVNKNASEDVKKAVIILNNIHVRDEAFLVDNTLLSMDYFPLRNNMACADESEYTHNVLVSIARGETTVDDYSFEGTPYKHLKEDIADMQVICKNMDWAKEDHITPADMDVNHAKFSRLYSLLVGDRPYATIEASNKISAVSYSPTESAEKYWSNLIAMEDEFVLQVITGRKDISEFDTFVSDWMAQGGEDILKEMQTVADGK